MHRTLRFAVLALALLIAGSGAVQARPLAVHPSPAGFFDALWQWISPLLPAWTKAGGMIDPDGRPTLLAPLPSSDAGGEMDPDG